MYVTVSLVYVSNVNIWDVVPNSMLCVPIGVVRVIARYVGVFPVHSVKNTFQMVYFN